MNACYLREIYDTHVIDTCVHIWHAQKLTILLPKIKNNNISKARANLEKPISFSDLATSKYPKIVKIFLAFEKKIFFVDQYNPKTKG